MKHRLLRCLTGILFLSLIPWSAKAQISGTGNELTIALDEENLKNPHVAYAPDGGFTVAWAAETASGHDLLLRRFDPEGNPLADAIAISEQGDNLEPNITFDRFGKSVLVWTSRATLFAQRFDATGAFLGDPITIYTASEGREGRDPRVEVNTEGDFAVVWTVQETSSPYQFPNSHLRYRLFAADGSPITEDLPVSSFTSASKQRLPRMALKEDGAFVIGWFDESQRALFARRFASDGTPTDTDAFPLTVNWVYLIFGFDISYDSQGYFVAAWQRFDAPHSHYLEGCRFAASGSSVVEEFPVEGTSSSGDVHVAFNTAGNFFVFWNKYYPQANNSQPFVRQFDREGNPIGESLGITPPEALASFERVFAMRPSGEFVHLWNLAPFRSSGGIFGQVFSFGNQALVGHWSLDEGIGIVAVNSSGNGLDGILEEGTSWTPGQKNQGAYFDGQDDLIRILDPGDSDIDIINALTLAFWVRPDRLGSEEPQVLVSKDNAYELDIDRLGIGQWSLRLSNQNAVVSSTPLQEGVWQHLAVTWDGTKAQLYRNGLLETSADFGGELIANNADLGIGARPSAPVAGGPIFHFEGALDEVQVFNTALQPEAIEQLMTSSINDIEPPLRSDFAPVANLPTGTQVANLSFNSDENAECRYDTSAGVSFRDMAGTFTFTGGTVHSTQVSVQDDEIFLFSVRCRDALGNTNGNDAFIAFGVGGTDRCNGRVGAWLFDEESGCTAGQDGLGPSGSLGPNCPSDGPIWTAGHRADDGALRFDGGNDLVEVPNSSAFASLNQLTLSAWVRRSGGSGYRSLVDLRDSTPDGYDLYLDPQSKPLLRVNQHTLTGQTVITDGQWHHLVGTYDGTTLRLFVDGILDSSLSVGATTIDVSQALRFGHHYSSTSNHSLSGDLGQIEIWDRALSSVDVLEHFLTNGDLSCPDSP